MPTQRDVQPVRTIPDAERRARLARRHGVDPAARLPDPVAATEAMTVLHATEPATVHLSVHARVQDVTVDDIEHALYTERSLVKQLAMRRTLFVFPRDLLPAAWGSASARVAVQHRSRLVKDVEQGGIAVDGAAWLVAAERAVLARLADGSAHGAKELREALPELAGRIGGQTDKKYDISIAIAPRVLTQLAVEGRIVRGVNGGHWRTSRPRWTSMASWLGEVPPPWPAADGYRELVRRWLRTFGPGTEADLVWWLGSTKAAVRTALVEVGAVTVALEDGRPAFLLPDDVDPVGPVEPWAALLPVLDPTVMGWKERAWYLGDHGPALFDTNGNAGTTAWWDGRVVGCWVQDEDGAVRVVALEPLPAEATAALQAEADRLTAWLAGVRVLTVYPSPAMVAAR
ncbi:winged helix DNA-binding domain-containing protein [Desertihabitans brevis]|uniref:Winged helix DNA-binding domain-containing protein n=1 Tax=Desertihabitans brevis TaxID=2268447 RepID=A0A367YZG5_9ACTN|nr:winged helix DNA-binding domain-containing protein [Desertihabitans brevis]RCK71313.1 winged helix DNA-binding domain-containing protein [Desertihabitans brevis]